MLSLNSIGQSIFELESGNRNVDGETNGQKTDKQMKSFSPISKGTYHDGDLSPCQVRIQLDKPFWSSSPETEILTDKQTKMDK